MGPIRPREPMLVPRRRGAPGPGAFRPLAPPGQDRGQRRVGLRPARVNVRDDGLRGNGSGCLARLAALLGHEFRHRRRPDRLDRRRLDPRERPGPNTAVGHSPEGVQVEPDHLGVARVEAPQDDVPRLPLQPVERGAERRLLGCASLPMQVFHARPPSVNRRLRPGGSLALPLPAPVNSWNPTSAGGCLRLFAVVCGCLRLFTGCIALTPDRHRLPPSAPGPPVSS